MRRRRNYRTNKYMWNGGVNNSNIPTSTQKKGMILKRSPNVSQSQKSHFSLRDMYQYYDWLLQNRIFSLPTPLEMMQFTYAFFDVFPYDRTAQVEQLVSCNYQNLLPNITDLLPVNNPGNHWSFIINGILIDFPGNASYIGIKFKLYYHNDMLSAPHEVLLLEPYADNVPFVSPQSRQKLFFNLAPAGSQTCYIQSFKQQGVEPFEFDFTRATPVIDQGYTPFDETTHGFCPFIYNEAEFFNATKTGSFIVKYPTGQFNDNKNIKITFFGFPYEVGD